MAPAKGCTPTACPPPRPRRGALSQRATPQLCGPLFVNGHCVARDQVSFRVIKTAKGWMYRVRAYREAKEGREWKRKEATRSRPFEFRRVTPGTRFGADRELEEKSIEYKAAEICRQVRPRAIIIRGVDGRTFRECPLNPQRGKLLGGW